MTNTHEDEAIYCPSTKTVQTHFPDVKVRWTEYRHLHQAYCQCGWHGAVRDSHPAANSDAVAHTQITHD